MLPSDEFAVDLRELDRPRPPGISAFMRIKNGEDFLEETIESHIAFFDEIVAVHNGCTDGSTAILRRLQRSYGEKLRVFHYEPEVYPLGSMAHQRAGTSSIHGMANYSNYALSKTTYRVVTKLDDDHLGIRRNVEALTSFIRGLGCRLGRRMICFSGINLVMEGRDVGVPHRLPFVGDGDHWFLEASSRHCFRQDRRFERLDRRGLKMEYHGISYWHLKYLKRGGGFDNYALDQHPGSRFHRQRERFEGGRAPISLQELESWCREQARRGGILQRLKRFVSGKARLRHERNERFRAEDLAAEFEAVAARLVERGSAASAGAGARLHGRRAATAGWG